MCHILLLCLNIIQIVSSLTLTDVSKSAAAITRSIITDFATRTAVPTVDPPPASLKARQVIAGGEETCALTEVGNALCWGHNEHGQLGDNSTTPKSWPTDVQGLNGVQVIRPGGDHACALRASDGVKCWGWNIMGQLGDGTTIDRLIPTDVVGLNGNGQELATGLYHTCAVTATDGIQCWGYNGCAQLGDGTTTDRLTPTDVVGLNGSARRVAAGGFHTCALTTTGGVKCWGDNFAGQLGDGTTVSQPTPVDVNGLTSGIQMVVTGGYHTCALTAAGGVKCWGANESGQLGDGTTTARTIPVDAAIPNVTPLKKGGISD